MIGGTMTTKTLREYEERLCEGFGSIHLIGNPSYELLKRKLLLFLVKNQVQYAMGQGLLNCVCSFSDDKRSSLNRKMSKISLYKNGESKIVVYKSGEFNYSIKKNY